MLTSVEIVVHCSRYGSLVDNISNKGLRPRRGAFVISVEYACKLTVVSTASFVNTHSNRQICAGW